MVESLDMDTSLTMTDDVKASQLKWIFTDMGIKAVDGGSSDAPFLWKGGTFIPNFTLLKYKV